MTLLTLQNVPDGFKQCHLKAPYVTEKQIRGGRWGEEGRVGGGGESGDLKTTLMKRWRGRGWICSKGRGLPT